MRDIDNPITRIEKTFGNARHIGWDFAANNDWGSAQSFLFNAEERNDPNGIFSWLGRQATTDIACEALFQLENGQRFFFGVGTIHFSEDKRKQVIGGFMEMPHGGSLVHTVDKIRQISGNPLPLPLDTTPRILSLGVGGLWTDVKSLTVWRKAGSGTILPFEEIHTRAPKPNEGFLPLDMPQPKNIMIEAGMGVEGRTFPCWLGFPVSEFDSGPPPRHTLSKDAYYAVAQTLAGCNLDS